MNTEQYKKEKLLELLEIVPDGRTVEVDIIDLIQFVDELIDDIATHHEELGEEKILEYLETIGYEASLPDKETKDE